MRKNIFKKITAFVYLTLIWVVLIFPINFIHAQTGGGGGFGGGGASGSFETPDTTGQGYILLAPLPCVVGTTPGCAKDKNGKPVLATFNATDASNLGKYLNLMITIFIGICAVLAVIMIVVGGVEYMTSELISSKEHGKERIQGAIFGLLLALGAYLILFTINPDILNTDLNSLVPATVKVNLGGEGTTPLNTATAPAQLQSAGINCPKSGGPSAMSAIAQSYIGHSSYSMEKRNTTSGGTAYVDCSSFVSQVYVCAGLSNPGGTTSDIFGSGITPITDVGPDGTTVILNGTTVTLQVGDLLGWKQGEDDGEGDKETNGHVVMYIGNGQVIDAQGSGVATRSLTSAQFEGRIKYIRRISAGASGGF
jgi:cell wall-associated NlpC family hydrolase